MAITPLPPWRSARVERTGEQLRITLHPRRILLKAALFVGALSAWTAGGMGAFRDISVHPARRFWIYFWLVIWTAWGVWAFPRLFWAAVGREIVVLNAHHILIRREIGGIGRSRVFNLDQVQDLHYELPPPVRYVPPSRGWPPLPSPRLGGSIRFQCGGRPHQFALGIDWPDMDVVLKALRERIHVASTGAGEAN